jgi:hypothetical protein
MFMELATSHLLAGSSHRARLLTHICWRAANMSVEPEALPIGNYQSIAQAFELASAD